MAPQESNVHGDSLRKGPWLQEEDKQLVSFVTLLGGRKWDFIAAASGLKRSGKSCRLRWLNYLRPNLKRGHISAEEEQIIIQLHQLWGNKWAKIARRLPGRTDNEIKNYWRTHFRKKGRAQEVNNSKQDLSCVKGETSSWNFSTDDYKSVEDSSRGSTVSSLEQYEVSGLTFMNSPYENRLYDWISELSSDQNAINAHRDCGGSFGSCFCYLEWNAEDGETGIFDSFGSLWDLS